MKKFHLFLLLLGLSFCFGSNVYGQLACNDNLFVSTTADGTVVITSDMLIEGQPAAPGMEIELINEQDSSDVITGIDEVTFQVFQNTDYFYTITDPITGNSCWGTIQVFSSACIDTLFLDFVDDVGIDQVIVDVVALNAQSIISLQWSNTYDGDILSFSGVEPGAIENISGISFNEAAPGLLNVAWFTPFDAVDFLGGEVLFSLKFDVLDNGDTELNIAPANSGVNGIPTEIIGLNDQQLCLNHSPAQLTSNGAKIDGNISRNDDLGCMISNPTGLQDWIVKIENSTDTYYVSSDDTGAYKRVVKPGDYTVTAYPYSTMWGFCDNNISVSLPNIGDQETADFTATAVLFCPFMQVAISTPFLRRCFDNTYTIEYCNYGTADATDAYIEVELDDFLTIASASVPYTQTGQTLTFDLGTVGLECGTISLVVNVSCDAELGQTHCTVAHIYPQDSCGDALQGWTGPIIEVDASCDGDSVRFTVQNSGIEDMLSAAEFIVVEDDVMTEVGNFTLDALASAQFSFPSNGSTYRFNAGQQVGFPYDEFATAFIEGCGTDENGEISTGFINDYSLGDYLPYTDWDCQENIGSYDPNDKASFPAGYGDEHYVKNDQTINYKIRFQNTGTDTAFRVVVIDTLSEFLDLSTFRYASASHRNEIALEDNVVKFTFDNILLVDSTANEAASHGYVSFTIDMLADLSDGIVINNNADIYFDFNEPIRTNTTFLEIGTDFIEDASVSTIENPYNMEIVVSPNPTSLNSTVHFTNHDLNGLTIEVSNIIGKRMVRTTLRDNVLDLANYNLVKGTYLIRLVHADNLVYSGKLIVH